MTTTTRRGAARRGDGNLGRIAGRSSGRGGDADLGLVSAVLRALLEETGAQPSRWTRQSFRRTLMVTKRQLGPIVDRTLLAESFGREAGGRRVSSPRDVEALLAVSAVDVAYALRWLELGGELVPEMA